MPLKIEVNVVGKFIVVRPRKYANDLGFVMFVDDSKVSWTSRGFLCAQFSSKEAAQEALDEIKRREKLRRKAAEDEANSLEEQENGN